MSKPWVKAKPFRNCEANAATIQIAIYRRTCASPSSGPDLECGCCPLALGAISVKSARANGALLPPTGLISLAPQTPRSERRYDGGLLTTRMAMHEKPSVLADRNG
jgi:hypothetical protein